MRPITEYSDYRKYMRDYYEERKKGSYFSWREFAKLAGFTSSGYLKLVCDGKTRLSRGGAAKVAGAMGLTGFGAQWWNTAMLRTQTFLSRFSPVCAP